MRQDLSLVGSAAAGQTRIDAAADVETPELLVFRFELAGPFQRASAYLIDVLLRGGLLAAAIFAFGLIFGLSGAVEGNVAGIGEGVLLLLWFGVEWFYHVLFEWLNHGQTPGKKAMGLQVVRTCGYPIGAVEALLRNLLRVADGLPLSLYMVGTVVSAADARFRRIGDLAADTMVVVDRRQRLQHAPTPEWADAQLVDQLPVNMAMDAPERRVVDAVVRRTRVIGRARMAEICATYAQALAASLGVAPVADPLAMVHSAAVRLQQADQRRRRKP